MEPYDEAKSTATYVKSPVTSRDLPSRRPAFQLWKGHTRTVGRDPNVGSKCLFTVLGNVLKKLDKRSCQQFSLDTSINKQCTYYWILKPKKLIISKQGLSMNRPVVEVFSNVKQVITWARPKTGNVQYKWTTAGLNKRVWWHNDLNNPCRGCSSRTLHWCWEKEWRPTSLGVLS